MFDLIIIIFVISVVFGTLLGMLMLIGSSIYDIAATEERVRPKRVSRTRLRRYRPLVSIIIPAYNEEQVIERCLDGLKQLRYRKLQIIVANDKSKDNTKAIVKKYIARYPKRNIILASKRKNGGRGAAINLGVKRAVGEIVVAFDADCLFEPQSIHRLVAHFADPDVLAVAANVRLLDDGTMLGMLQRLEYLVSFRSKKFNTLTKSEFIIGGAGASYRMSKLKQAGGFDERMKTEDIELSMRMTRKFGTEGRMIYASDYIVHTEPVPTFSGLIRQRFRWKFGSLQALYHNRALLFSRQKNQNPFTGWVRLPYALFSEFMLLMEPLLFSMFIFIAITTKSPLLFISACAAYTMVTWLAIWSDEHYKLATKSYLTFIAPMMYPMSLTLSFVQVYAAFKSLRNIKGILGIDKVSGAYVSTQRSDAVLEVVT